MAEINRALSIRGWSNLHKFFAYFEKVIAKIPNGEYKQILGTIETDARRTLEKYKTADADEKKEIEQWFGYPIPANIEELVNRIRYEDMPKYDRVSEDLRPYLEELAKNSSINIPIPKLKTNDRELGSFSFEKAMMMPTPVIGYYSLKHKKFVPVKEIKSNSKGGYLLKDDNSEIEIRQLEEDGVKKISTDNKSSFLYKAPVVKPHRAIQLFINITVNCGHPAFWAGVTGMAMAKYLESRGYAVGITMVSGIAFYSGMKHNGVELADYHTRYTMVELKEIGGGYDTLSLLYALADGTFFRYKIFQTLVAQQYEYSDRPTRNLGSAVQLETMEEDIGIAIKRRDWHIAQNALEFYIGGDDLVREEQAKSTITRIVASCEARNMLVMASLTPELLPSLIAAYDVAVAEKSETFVFNGKQIGVLMAKYMIDYLRKQK